MLVIIHDFFELLEIVLVPVVGIQCMLVSIVYTVL